MGLPNASLELLHSELEPSFSMPWLNGQMSLKKICGHLLYGMPKTSIMHPYEKDALSLHINYSQAKKSHGLCLTSEYSAAPHTSFINIYRMETTLANGRPDLGKGSTLVHLLVTPIMHLTRTQCMCHQNFM